MALANDGFRQSIRSFIINKQIKENIKRILSKQNDK